MKKIIVGCFIVFACVTLQARNKFTTVFMGSYPKPDSVNVPCFDPNNSKHIETPTRLYDEYLEKGGDSEANLRKAMCDIVKEQEDFGFDVVSVGEIRNAHPIYSYCRHIGGIDFIGLTKAKTWLDQEGYIPTVIGPVKANFDFLIKDFKLAQAETDKPLKVSIPGPITIAHSVSNNYYDNVEDLVDALANEIRLVAVALTKVGCKWIQIDEPIFAKKPRLAMRLGVKALARCFDAVPRNVISVLNVGCGDCRFDSPPHLRLARYLDQLDINAIAIQDASVNNNLKLFQRFEKTSIILGICYPDAHKVESVTNMAKHIKTVVTVVPSRRLMISNCCDYCLFDAKTFKSKIGNMMRAISLVG
jgi:5-methyltetrahydropteroyltriglutamate--homocysteine methyltransferase